jgi:hypothetical protein
MREGVTRLKEEVVNDHCVAGPLDAKGLKSAKWCLSIESTVCAQGLKCTLDALERVASDPPGKPAQFIPIRFIFTNKLGRHDKLLLGFDALVLSEALGREVDLGKIVHGEDYVTLKVKTAALGSDVRKITAEIVTLLSGRVPPDLILNRHCPECQFQQQCRGRAEQAPG